MAFLDVILGFERAAISSAKTRDRTVDVKKLVLEEPGRKTNGNKKTKLHKITIFGIL